VSVLDVIRDIGGSVSSLNPASANRSIVKSREVIVLDTLDVVEVVGIIGAANVAAATAVDSAIFVPDRCVITASCFLCWILTEGRFPLK
jgi:hypothetical protein